MSSNLFGLLGNNQFSNMANFLQQFNQFKQNFTGDPKQQVQQMLNSGKISQSQFNQVANLATQIQKAIK